MVSTRAGAAAPGPRGWRGPWLAHTALVSVAFTAFDAVILQQKKAFFTGGFLSAYHLRGPVEAAGFVAASILSDAGAAAVLVAAAMWLAGFLRLKPMARHAAVLMLAAAPLLVADFVMYQLAAYLGDAFDLSLMFDLTGGRPSEFLAVSSQHLIGPSLLLLAGGGVAAAVVWVVNRAGRSDQASRLRVPARALAVALAVFAGAGIGTALVSASSDTFEDGLRRKPSGRLFASLTELATDVDRDGFGIGGRLADPAPLDAAIFPYALDVPGDGIDQNGVAGDLPAGLPPYIEPENPASPWVRKPAIVLVVLETFRADAVGRVVNGRRVTPVLDALARQGISADLAFSHNGYTTDSRFHIFSGSLAGLRGGRTLVDDFQANGYEVAYFSGQDESFGGPEHAVGFDRADAAYDARQDRARRYSTFSTAGSLAVPNEVVRERIGEFLARREKGRPLFLYVNFHDTHYPYHHEGLQPLVSSRTIAERDIHPSRAGLLHEVYFNAAANVDAAVGTTLAMVREHLGTEPAVIVTADHGESLFDEGFLGHGYALNDVQTRIPLIVSGLGVEIEQPFAQVDLRDAIAAALSREDAPAAPVLRTNPGKHVFQYLGPLDRPRQIGSLGVEGRTIFDLRTNRVRFNDGEWEQPGALDPPRRQRFLDLVHLWERMMLARAGAR